MSQLAKKIKLDVDDDVSMDPFDEEILPFDVHENILQYLNGSDLLKASEVSRRWNQKVEIAKGFLEKIKLKITSIPAPEGVVTRSKSRDTKNQLTMHDIAAVLKSKRHYVNVEIKFGLLQSFALCQKLLKKFADSIKFMTCDQYIDLENPAVTFPNLTQMEMLDWNCRNYWSSFLILLPLMPAVETLRVDTVSAGDRVVISISSKSLKEVRCKRLLPDWTLFVSDPSRRPGNKSIQFIVE